MEKNGRAIGPKWRILSRSVDGKSSLCQGDENVRLPVVSVKRRAKSLSPRKRIVSHSVPKRAYQAFGHSTSSSSEYHEVRFELEVTTRVTSQFLAEGPRGRAVVTYAFELQMHLAADNSARVYELPIIISDGVASDETIRVRRGQNQWSSENDLSSSSWTRDSRERSRTVTLVRHAEDLCLPFQWFLTLIYPIERGKGGRDYIYAIVPQLCPRTGVLRRETIFVGGVSPPFTLKMDAVNSFVGWKSWIRDNTHIFERMGCRNSLYSTALDPVSEQIGIQRAGHRNGMHAIRLCFERWREVTFHENRQWQIFNDTTHPNAPGLGPLAWDFRVDLAACIDGQLTCRIRFLITVTSRYELFRVHANGWRPEYYLISGTPFAGPNSNVDVAGLTIPCWRNPQGEHVVPRQPGMIVGSVMRLDLRWDEPHTARSNLQRVQDHRYVTWLPRLTTHRAVGIRIRSYSNESTFSIHYSLHI